MVDLSHDEGELVDALEEALVTETGNAPRTVDELAELATDIFPDTGVPPRRVRELARVAHDRLVRTQRLEPVRGDPDRWQPSTPD